LVAYCPLHGCQVLLGLTGVRRLTNLAPGVLALELECYDGQQLVVLTGKHVTTADEPGPAGTAAP
jgi:hypothetical protein